VQVLSLLQKFCPFQVPDASFDFVAQNQGLVRSLPLWAGGAGFAGLLLNRTLSGVGDTAVHLVGRVAEQDAAGQQLKHERAV